ncbi:probable LRR receptor-like serine/threonine-protein kinase RFK1 isoform X3 [Vitis vinifera]|uniref:probable LRR receptor-like serine/threonine-protein kinase RFK1 isoform X3 n=1 Tax=Vitis vinifera TaxID=29760 RepID=UPI0008FEC9FB|nr:probable LRR receptor-like serine/threonine-protein kinase RFK1 isoform X3 [Vitis vinifera]|eukprot:XP_019078074.1 PREDICTED: probable LRR receptor-like serine/threonine-protein kinase RFK1 isoform X3 [Vitis vinifera]
MVGFHVVPYWIILALTSCCGFVHSKLPQSEVDALARIVRTMGATYWKFDGDSCQIETVGLTPQPPRGSEQNIICNNFLEKNNTALHVVSIMLKGYNLPGVLPPELVELQYLQEIDFAYNYLGGTIPPEWASAQLSSISVLANRLSGEIPKELGNITSLTYLNLEANQFSGIVPPVLGDLINLKTLILSSNQFFGNLPTTLAGLRSLTDFRINDNNLSGPIPEFIQNWKQLTRIEMHASGLEGPIPSNISLLDKLIQLRISDINGTTQAFPMLIKMTGIVRLILRNCKISGEIPAYIWKMKYLEMLDVSFNNLVGEIPNDISSAKALNFIYLSSNLLSGNVPDLFLKKGSSMNLNLNLYRSSSMENNLRAVLPCSRNVNCPRYVCSFYINCGGNDLTIKERRGKVVYQGDAKIEGGAANYYTSNSYWGLSSSGDFMDDNNFQNTRYIETLSSGNISGVYTTARLSPLSLTYFGYCLENGIYTLQLHFTEIYFTDDKTYNSLGKRLFDIYIQEKLVHKNFNIEDEAHGARNPVMKQFNASVINNILEIRFYWAGKGTTRIPYRGVYGPLISAISVYPNFKSCSSSRKEETNAYIIGGVVGLFIIFLILGLLAWKGCLRGKKKEEKAYISMFPSWIDLEGLDMQTGSFTLKQIKAATKNFDFANKIGEGGFGPVYKGLLSDGTIVAVKQLSSISRQGNREFLNEIAMISCLQHPNLVKLHGCCVEGDQLLLVYEYMENNSLAGALFGPENGLPNLDWPTRLKICIGIAKGLAFLHEESRIKIVHRDIKATNVLLDRDLNPKISDFGLARLDEGEKSHISTRVAGTIGYMAPEYALWGYLTYKADVYSFGIVALEIVSGKHNNNYIPSNGCLCLLDWACLLQQSRKFLELVDEKLGSKVNEEEAERMIKVALLCTNASQSLRPTMSEVVSMLEARMPIPDMIPGPSTYTEDLRFKAMRDFRQDKRNQSLSEGRQSLNLTGHTELELCSTSTSGPEFYEINPHSESC